MKNKSTNLKWLMGLALGIFLWAGNYQANAQCVEGLPAGGAPTTFRWFNDGSSNMLRRVWANEYIELNLIAGHEYVFSSYSNEAGTLMTTDDITIAKAPYSITDVITYGTTPITYTITTTGIYRLYVHSHLAGCGVLEKINRFLFIKSTPPVGGPATSIYNGDGKWSKVSNWSNGLPGSLTDVTINGNLAVDGSNFCNNLTISPTGAVKVASANALTVLADLLVESNSVGTGSFIGIFDKNGETNYGSNRNNYKILGTTTIQRFLTGGWALPDGGWHQISSPVAAQPIADFVTLGVTVGDYDFYGWDEPSDTWKNFKASGFANWNLGENLNVGQGYLVSFEAPTITRDFIGTMNNKDVIPSLTKTAPAYFSGWNLLGNPFASALIWNNGTKWARNNVNGVAKIWKAGSYIDINPDGIIPAGQGFMVQAGEQGTAPSIVIPAGSRVHSSQDLYKSSTEQLLLVAAEAEGSLAQESKVIVNSMATESFDSEYDAYFLAGDAPKFYSVVGDENLSTNSLPSIDAGLVIPFGFEKNAASDFTITLQESLPGRIVYLTDNKSGTVTNLTETSVYSFTSNDGDDANRFSVTFGTLGINNPESAEAILVYTYGDILYLQTPSKEAASVNVYDITGKLVMQAQTIGEITTLNASELSNGIYVVNVVLNNSVVSRKVSIRK